MKRFLYLIVAIALVAIASEASACHPQQAFSVQSAPCGYYAPSAVFVQSAPQAFFFQSRGAAAFQFQANPGDRVRFRQGPFRTSLRIN